MLAVKIYEEKQERRDFDKQSTNLNAAFETSDFGLV